MNACPWVTDSFRQTVVPSERGKDGSLLVKIKDVYVSAVRRVYMFVGDCGLNVQILKSF